MRLTPDHQSHAVNETREPCRLMAILAAALAVLLLAACDRDTAPATSAIADANTHDGKSAVQLYNEAIAEVAAGNPANASGLFDEVERQHPYSALATQAKLMSAWALYQSNNYTAAIRSIDDFISLHPAHKDVPYALYIRALCYYERIVDVERDAGMTRAAREAFEVLLTRFPDSDYTRDARLKLDLTISHLAAKQMAVGRFYLKRGHYDAALRRFAAVVEEYDTSNQTPEALYRMVEAYLALGLNGEAARSNQVLTYNYPDSVWAGRAGNLIAAPGGEAAAQESDGGGLRGLLDRITPG